VLSHNVAKGNQSVTLRSVMAGGDLITINPNVEDPANSIIRAGSGLDHLVNIGRILEPWEVLLDLGHFSSFNYQVLSMALQDFRNINERTMANTLLHLAVHNAGTDDL
jgi:hypothetical protein